MSRRETELRRAYQRENPKAIKRVWNWTEGKLYYLKRFGIRYHWPRKVKKKWTRFRILLAAIRHYHVLRTDGPYWLLHNLFFVGADEEPETRYGQFNIDQICRRYGIFVGSAARMGLKSFWRQYRSPPRGKDLNTIYHASILALIGLETAVHDGLDMASLSPEEAEIAAGHALYEINGFPTWLPALAMAHPEAVRRVYRPQIEAEFGFPENADGPHGLLSDLRYGSDEVRRIGAPDVLDLLKRGNPENLRVLELALSILGQSDPAFRSELIAMAPDRISVALAEHRKNFLLLWLALWLQLDALPALDFLEKHLTDHPAEADAFVVGLADILRGDRTERVAVVDPDFRNLAALRRLIPILYRHIRPEEDLRHEGVFSSGPRDHAEEFRSACVNWLMEIRDPRTYDVMVELANEPALARPRNWILAKAAERARQDAEEAPWDPRKVAEFVKRFERLPSTADELFEVVMGRLEDIRENAEHGDFSLRGMFRGNEKEEVFQKLGADRLDVVSRGVYQVAREVEVAAHKLPDIRIFRAGVGIVTIEVKVANRYSFNELRDDALKDQLVGQYMKIRQSRHGVLLVVNLKAGRTWQPSGQPAIDFAALCQCLTDEARRLSVSRNRDEKISVVGIDLS